MPASAQRQICMDLIADDLHVIRKTQVRDRFEFFHRPHASTRIVRRAPEQHLYLLFPDPLLHLFEIDLVTSVYVFQITDGRDPSVPLHAAFKLSVYRLKDQHMVVRLCQNIQCMYDPDNNARYRNDLRRIDLPVISSLEPAGHGFIVFFVRIIISEESFLRHFHKRIRHFRHAAEIHIRNPHGDQVIDPLDLFILDISGYIPVDHTVKVVHV